MKKCLVILLNLACNAHLPAQVITLDATTTRAVVIGISDYQDEKIPDLRFADRDAEAFAQWLRSPAGGSLGSDQIMLMTNGQAKAGNLVAAFTWLIEDSKPGDRAVFYFSGHGDVENVTMFQDGYLLAYDAPPIAYMAGGALPVFTIGRIVNTLSGKGVQVVMVTDACRAGKLAGSENGGAKATTAALQQQFANEVKILSCQPDEFSLEGEQWGGGRGCFSYHLTDGLCGMADKNADQQVSLMEIGNYLQETVVREAAPQSQIPMTVGNPKSLLATVDEATLAALKSQRAGELASLKPIETRGMEELTLAKVDTGVQQMYREFLAAIKRGDLMPSASGKKSADDYYRTLIAEPELAQLHGLMKRNFAAALQNEAQEVTNKLLKSDPFVVSDSWSRPFVYDHIPAYLERATEILGEGHFIYKQLKAKQCFFEAKTYRRDRHPDISADSLLEKTVSKLEEGLGYDTSAAYLQVELGVVLFWRFFEFQKAMAHAKNALALSPNWAYAQVLAGRCFAEGELNLEQGVKHYLRALELDSSCLLARQELFWMNWFHRSPAKKSYRDAYIREVEKLLAADSASVPVYLRTWYGLALVLQGRAAEAATILEKIEQETRQQDFVCYQFLNEAYVVLNRNDDNIRVLKKLIEINPKNLDPYYQLINIYMKQGQEQEAKAIAQEILDSRKVPVIGWDVYGIGLAWLVLGDKPAMQRTIDEGFRMFGHDDWGIYFITSKLYYQANEEQKAFDLLEIAFQKGFDTGILMPTEADNYLQTDEFKVLVKKYFPDQQKN